MYVLLYSVQPIRLPFLQETTYGFSSFILYCYCVHSINYDVTNSSSPHCSSPLSLHSYQTACLWPSFSTYSFLLRRMNLSFLSPVRFLYKFIALVLVLLFHIPFVTDILFPPYWVILMNMCILLFLFQSYVFVFHSFPHFL